MNTQEQVKHLKELIQFLEIQNKNLPFITPIDGVAIKKLFSGVISHLNDESGISVLGSTFIFQNEFRDFLRTWVLNRDHSDFGMNDLFHNQMKARAGVYLRQLTRIYKELLEATDNKPPQKENHD